MTQVSKLPIRKEIEKRVFEIFLESVAMVRTLPQVDKLLRDLLSPTEKIMLAKRISIAVLLLKHYDHRFISKFLKVGLGTVNKVSMTLKTGTGGYEMVASEFLR